MQRYRRPALYFLIALALGIFYCLPAFEGQVIGPFGQIAHMAPWNQPAPSDHWNVLQADGVLQFFGWRSMVLEAYAKGQMPFWNPYELAGTPLLANSQSAGFYPPLMILGLLHASAAFTVNFLAMAHLFWAAFGAYLLCKTLGAKEIPARISAALFGTCPFLLSWLPLSSVGFTCSWIPWALFFLARLPHSKRPGLSTAGLAVSVAMMFLAGHLQFAAFGSMAIGVAWAVQLLDRKWLVSALGLVGIVAGGMLAAPQVLPGLAFSQFSHRRNTPTEDGYAKYVELAMQPFELATLTNPAALGDPTQDSSIMKEPRISCYWPPIIKNGANYAESAVTIGPLALILLFFVRWRDRRTWALALIGLMGLAIAMGSPVDKLLYFSIPGWSATGSPGRAIVLFVFAALIAASLALSRDDLPDWLTAPKLEAKQLLVFIGTLAPLAFIRLAGTPPEAQQVISDGLAQNLLLYWGAGAVLAYLAIIFVRNDPKWSWGHLLFWIGLFAPMFRTFGTPMPPVSGPATDRIAVLVGRWNLYDTPKALLPPNTAGLNHIHELGGYDSLIHRDTVAMLHDVDTADPASLVNGNMMLVSPLAKPDALANAGVSELWSLKPDPTDPTKATGEVLKTRIPGPGRVSSTGGPASIVDEGYDGITVKATGPGTLTLRDRNMPGWTASIGGKDVPIADGLWRTVELPPGEQTVAFRYTPPGFKQGETAFLLGVMLLGGLLATSVRKKPLPNTVS